MRRLGVGSGSSSNRPLRAQIIVALVVVAILFAVPLYLWRHPSNRSKEPTAPSASASVAAGPSAVPLPSAARSADPAAAGTRLKLGPVQKVKCGSSASAANVEGALCDGLPAFEEAFKRAIVETESCAPKLKEPGTINYVLTVDFARKKLHVYPGASGDWRGRQARRATACVARAVKVENWTALPHQHRFYAIAVMASYAVPATLAPPPAPPPGAGLPNFE